VILAYGALVNNALTAARTLSAQGVECTVVSARFAKPLDEELIAELLESGKPMIIVEDHSRIGGFGSAVFEMAQQRGLKIDLNRITHLAMPGDTLVPHGSRSWQLEKVGLDAAGIASAVTETLKKSGSQFRISSTLPSPSSIVQNLRMAT
jgi:1-deoxy-D-xylulose-5-phosphate synthase